MVLAAAALVLVAGSAGAARGASSETYFLTSTALPLDRSNPWTVRPELIYLYADGGWNLEKLQWTGWGTNVAHATGLSSASNGIPNMAEGKRIIKPAQVTLSKPGQVRGHRVYRCFRLTIPSSPKSNQSLCLQKSGGYTLFLSPGRGDSLA